MKVFDDFSISRSRASGLVSVALGRRMEVTAILPTSGGMINSVQLWELSGPPGRCVVKLSAEAPKPDFRREADALELLRRAGLPCPHVLFVEADGERFPFSALGLEYLPGAPLSHACLSAADRLRLDLEMADVFIRLHSHTRGTFGPPDGAGVPRWIDVFRPRFEEAFTHCAGRMSGKIERICRLALERMEEVIGSRPRQARLVHGDVWAGNIIVRPGAEKVLSGIVDPGALWADAEYELAYMQGFSTVGPAFMQRYCSTFPLESGYELRRDLYNLHTMLVHIWLFGDGEYHRTAEGLAGSLAAGMGWSV